MPRVLRVCSARQTWAVGLVPSTHPKERLVAQKLAGVGPLSDCRRTVGNHKVKETTGRRMGVTIASDFSGSTKNHRE